MQDIAVDNTCIWNGFRLVIYVQVSETWECAEENKVRYCQTEKVNVAALPLGQTENVPKYDEEVSTKTDTKFNNIKC